MTDDMRRLFAEHRKIDGPPLSVTTDDLAKRGRRRILRRNVGYTGGLSAVVALIAVAAMLLPGTFASATGTPAGKGGNESTKDNESTDSPAEPPDEQPLYPLPDVPEAPDGQYYSWDAALDIGTSDAAEAYGDAFVAWFNERNEPLEDWQGMQINRRELTLGPSQGEGSFEVVDSSIPYYGIANDEGDGSISYGDDDTLGLLVYPRGSFKEGPGDTYEYLVSCTDGVKPAGMTGEPDYTCEEEDGPNGERVLTVKMDVTEAGATVIQSNRAVVYREDGTAVEVVDFVQGDASHPAGEPRLGLAELADLALSMPGAVVED